MGLLPQAPLNNKYLQPLHAFPHDESHKSKGIIHKIARLIIVCVSCFVVIGIPISYRWLNDHILPGIYIDGVYVGEKTQTDAVSVITKRGLYLPPPEVVVEYRGTQYSISTTDLGLSQNPDLSIKEAMQYGKSGPWTKRLAEISQLILQDKHLHVARSIRQDALQAWVESLAKSIDKPGKKPSVSLRTSGSPQSLSVFVGVEGREVQKKTLQEAIVAALNNTSKTEIDPISISVDEVRALSSDEVGFIKERALPFIGKKILFQADDASFTVNDQKIISALAIPTGVDEKEVERIVLGWATSLERATQEPSITVVSNIVTTFTPPRSGRSLDAASSKAIVLNEIQRLERSQSENTEPISLPMVTVQPRKQLSELNSLGINERIGHALTTFYHSIPGRVHNVGLVGKYVHLEMIPPGGVFSYNKAVGEVSRATGFLSAYIIQQGRTVLGDGGGVCQGSTTFFRAALNAGLPIVERRGHSYRVGYYEQNALPGLDATSFSPSPDFKFSNDTPGHILVTASVDEKNYTMIIELWGTSDGRTASITEHRLFNQTPAKPTIYQDDPSLPVGVLKQVDWSAPGAKTSFRYIVKRGEKILQDRVFTTAYQPWAAVFLRGTRQ